MRVKEFSMLTFIYYYSTLDDPKWIEWGRECEGTDEGKVSRNSEGFGRIRVENLRILNFGGSRAYDGQYR
jgi:hypothetical protein